MLWELLRLRYDMQPFRAGEPSMSHKELDARRRRVNRLKRLIIFSWIAVLLILAVTCGFLFYRERAVSRELRELRTQVDELIGVIGQMSSRQESMEQDAGGQAFVLPQETTQAGDGASDTDTAAEPESENVRKVYLTFDDGPSAHTNEILDILAEYDVKATFFVVGKTDEKSKEALRRIVKEGHTLGMHSYSHKYGEIYDSAESFAEDLEKLQDYLYEVTGTESMFYRFPGGSSNTISKVDMQEFIGLLHDRGIEYFDWNVSSQDASPSQLSADKIVQNCMKDLEKHRTPMILMHDAAGKGTTVEALPLLLDEILALENTVVLPITEDTGPVQHITMKEETED